MADADHPWCWPKREGDWTAGHNALATAAGYASWQAWAEVVGKERGRRICGGKTRGGTPCSRIPNKARPRCKLHGGATPIGAAAPQSTSLRYSRYLRPGTLTDVYENTVRRRSKELWDLIGVAEGRLVELLTDLPTAAADWDGLRDDWRDFYIAREEGDAHEADRLAVEISRRIEAGTESAAAWTEINDQTEVIRKLTDSQARIEKQDSEAVTKSHLRSLVLLIADGFSSACKAHIKSERERNAVLTQTSEFIFGLLGAPDRKPTGQVIES